MLQPLQTFVKRRALWILSLLAGGLLLLHLQRTWPSCRVRTDKPCQYGNLPGRWVDSADGQRRWQLLEPRCQLQDLLQPAVEAGRLALADGGDCPVDSLRARILLLGDSVDRSVLRDSCHAATDLPDGELAKVGQACMHVFLEDEGWVCRLPGIALANQAFWGVSPVGPYNLNRTGDAAERIHRALSAFPARFGAPPDLIVIAALLWDLARWKMLDAKRLMAADELPRDLLDEWLANADALFRLLKAEAPRGTALAFHTLHFPRLDAAASNGTLLHGTISRRAHVAQLNAAGRHLAALHGFQVIDMEAMTAAFHDAGPYLLDNTHQAPWLSREFANVCLNIAAAARMAGPGSRTALQGQFAGG